MAQFEPHRTGTSPVTEWSARFRTVDSTASSPRLENGLGTIPGGPSAPSPPAFTSFCPPLLLWPHPRPFGPPQSSVFDSRGLEPQGICSGECCCSDLSGGWSTGLHERFLARLGFGPQRTSPRTAEGWKLWRKGCLFSEVQPAGPRRHVGVGLARERDSPQERGQSRRHRPARSMQTQREDLSWSSRAGTGRVRMVVIAGEVGGRWSEETKAFLWSLACEKSLSEARVMRGSVRAAWYRRWCCLLACAAAKAVALSLLERRGVPGVGR